VFLCSDENYITLFCGIRNSKLRNNSSHKRDYAITLPYPTLSPMMTKDDVREILRSECEAVGGPTAWAKRHVISTAYVSDVLHERRLPGKRILEALRIRRFTAYAMVEEAAE
jgi:hypothetical protein